MYIVLFLIIISLFIAIGFLIAFFWAVKTGQYEDDYTPAMRILLDDDKINTNQEKPLSQNVKTIPSCRQ